MRALIHVPLVAVLMAGCSGSPFGFLKPKAQAVEPFDTRPVHRPEGTSPVPLAGARTAAALDTTTAAEKAAALAAPPAPGGERLLGRAAVALGNPAEPGFWLRAALVTAPGKGRVVVAGGGSIAVDLIPGAGAAQLSLAAFRALGLGLTDLPEVTVFAN